MPDAVESENVAGSDRRGPSHQDVDIFVTASEAYPAFERAVLGAREEIVAGFRIFDFATRLRSPEGRAVGRDWFDLLLDALRRGVAIRILLSDFDPVVGTALHGSTWRSMRAAAGLAEMAPEGARLEVVAALHPAGIGMPARLALWPRVRGLVRSRLHVAAERGEAVAVRFLDDHPHLARFAGGTAGRLRPNVLAPPTLWPVTHHQKVCAIDGRVAYVGGLDLNDRRWDTPAHDRPAEETWYDVQLLIRDVGTAEALRTHLGEFVAVTEGEQAPTPLGGRILRTLSARVRGRPTLLAPDPVLTEIEGALLDAIASARRTIYLETQFLRDRRIARALAAAGRQNPDLRLMVVLPAAPEDVAFEGTTRADARFGEYLQASCLRKLRRAYRSRLLVASPVQPRAAMAGARDRAVLFGAPIVYVHAKVSVIDERLAIVGSANLNGRSLRWDTEVAVPLLDPVAVARLRRRLLAHWLGQDAGARPELLEGPDVLARWKRLVSENAHLAPEARTGFLVPHSSRASRLFGKSLPAVPEEMV